MIAREVFARLLEDMGCAVQSVGRMRRLAESKAMDDTAADEVSTKDNSVLTPNRPVEESTRHHLKWIAQVSEYWPLLKQATLLDEEMLALTADKPLNHHPFTPSRPLPNAGELFCWALGSDPALLTLLTHQILIIYADLVLANKLVP